MTTSIPFRPTCVALALVALLGILRAAEPSALRCEFRSDPLGIDAAKPNLGWVLGTGTRGARQTAYHILAASSGNLLAKDRGDLWDSGKVDSAESVHVPYAGTPLASSQQVFWKVRSWDQEGTPSAWSRPAQWTMGLLGAEAWKVSWIQWTPPRAQRDEQFTFLLPGDAPQAFDRLVVHNHGGKAGTFAKDFSLQASATAEGDEGFATVLTGTLTPTTGPQTFPVGPVRREARRIRLLIHSGHHPGGGVSLAEVEVLAPDGRNLIGAKQGGRLVSFTSQENPKVNAAARLNDGVADGKDAWISKPEPPANACPWLRRTFDLAAVPERALVHLNAAGYAELYINGGKAGTDVLTPAVSEHSRQTLTVTYDVTPLLRPGRNVVAIWLARGWAEGIPQVRAQLTARTGGQDLLVGTDATWRARASSHRHIGGWNWGDFGGELIDAREHLAGWNLPGLDDATWAQATVVPGPKGVAAAQQAPLNRIGASIPAVQVTDLGGGRHEIDFGTALTGWLRLKLPPLKSGAEVTLSFADARNADAKRGTSGHQTFNQVSRFISAGGTGEVFENRFNYAGFRFVIVEGLPAAPAKEDATGLLVESDLIEVGAFTCSNDLLNRIHHLNQWTQRCLDLGGYYVDCPTRERLGYGDGQVAVEGFMTSFAASEFYRKWLRDWRLRQAADGKMPNVAPCQAGGGGPAWAGLLATITWRHYLYYGDRRILEENYDAIRRYVDFLETRCTAGILRKYGGQWDFIGDWVPPGRGMDTKNWPAADAAEFFNNCYRTCQWDLLAHMAAALGRDDEVTRCAAILKTIRPAIHAAFFDPAGKRYVIDEQAYLVMPLVAGIVPEAERAAVLGNLERNILVKNQGHLDTGMLGTYFLMEHLREIGRNDLVFTMFNQTTQPGWGYMLEKGATTCWEQWNGYYSHMHSCFTGADNWLYQGPGGISPDPAGPGFKRSIIRPTVVGDLAWAKAHHDSPYGRIACAWRRDGGSLTLEVTIPANTTATVHVPARDAAGVSESGKPVVSVPGVVLLRQDAGSAVFTVGAGNYTFRSTLP